MAEKITRLVEIYIGRKVEIGSGYWLCNVTGVDKNGALIVPFN